VRVGLLVCGHVREEFRSLAGDYPQMFAGLFAGHPDIELRPYDLTAGEFPTSTAECAAWIGTGSRWSVNDDVPWIRRLEDLVAAFVGEGRRFVGVCFGHQMIGRALGGEVARSERGWGVGVKEVGVHLTEDWMTPPAPSYRVLNSHADQIVRASDGIRVLGSNEHCPISMLAVGDHVLGIQGHPEFVPGYARALMEGRRGRLIPEEVVDAGLGTLAEPVDRELLAGWIAAFLLRDLR
jgi:GMP synthase-like glutamine amidotransferase